MLSFMFEVFMKYCSNISEYDLRSIINICFYPNFSTPLPIKALMLPLTFNSTLCLSNPLALPTHFNYFASTFYFNYHCK